MVLGYFRLPDCCVEIFRRSRLGLLLLDTVSFPLSQLSIISCRPLIMICTFSLRFFSTFILLAAAEFTGNHTITIAGGAFGLVTAFCAF